MRYRLFIVLAIFLCGCAAPQRIADQATRAPSANTAPKIEVPSFEPLPVRIGIIFGKTDFKGVLKTSYVKLSILDVSDPQKKYNLYIGDQLGASLLPTKSVEPGYFFLELPAGIYKIYSISIPLGSTLATEEINITFTIQADQVNYIGTLEVVGLGEKAKFGGVPLIIPGFDYYFDILDEREEALKEFHNRYPLIRKEILIHLMQNTHKPPKFNSVPAAEPSAKPFYAAHTEVKLIPEEESLAPGKELWVALRMKTDDDWHVYWKNPGDSGTPPKIKWSLPQGFSAGSILWPIPQRISAPPLMSYGYEREIFLPTSIRVPEDVSIGTQQTINAHIDWLACKVQCIPGRADLSVTLPVQSLTPQPNSLWKKSFEETRKDLPGDKVPWNLEAFDNGHWLMLRLKSSQLLAPKISGLYFYPERSDIVDHAAKQSLKKEEDGYVLLIKRSSLSAEPLKELKGLLVVNDGQKNTSAWDVEISVSAGALPIQNSSPDGRVRSVSFIIALLFAFLGGLILNLMPCVLPVLALKVLGLIQKAKEEKSSSLREGLMFSLGVVVSFWVLAALLFILQRAGRQIGWGFQFQSPFFIIILAGLFFILALNLLGVFEIILPTGIFSRWTQESRGRANSFFNGVLATVAATPCTAPFMGTALGFALTQPMGAAFLIFSFLGLGMAFPYLLLSCFPQLLRFLPKPGRWMVTFKKLLAIPLLLTVLWLGWILYVSQRSAFIKIEQQTHQQGIPWRAFTQEELQSAIAEGKPVFIDFTAAWCLTCQANERLALNNPKVIKKFAEMGIVALKADWTTYDEKITQALKVYGKDSIPLYVFYPAAETEGPILLPELITPTVVLRALNKNLLEK